MAVFRLRGRGVCENICNFVPPTGGAIFCAPAGFASIAHTFNNLLKNS